jgi:hypothetical protein
MGKDIDHIRKWITRITQKVFMKNNFLMISIPDAISDGEECLMTNFQESLAARNSKLAASSVLFCPQKFFWN